MVKTTIIPQNSNYSLEIPKSYIGKKIEVLLYALDELTEEKPTSSKKPSDFFGSLSNEEGNKFHAYVNKAREEWSKDF